MFIPMALLLGILAGITMIAELFLSEGKSQVYGNVHGLLQSNKENTDSISKPVELCTM